MHIHDSIHANFLTAAIQKRKQTAGMISMPVRDHDAFNGAEWRFEARQIAGERFGVRTGVEECKSGRVRVCCLICFLVNISAIRTIQDSDRSTQSERRNHGRLDKYR